MLIGRHYLLMHKNLNAINTKKKKAQLLIQQRQLGAAKKLYIEICRLNRHDAEVWFMLGAINGELGLIDETIECSQKAIKLQPKYVGAYLNIARALLHKGKHQEVIKICRKAASIKNDFPQLHLTLGLAYAALGNHAAAINSFKKTIKLDSKQTEAYLNLGLSLIAIGNSSEAINCFQTVTKQMPVDIRAYQQLITLFRNTDKLEEALEYYIKLLEMQPQSAVLHHDIGATLVAIGRGEEAIAYYEKAIDLDPEFAAVYLGLGEVYLLKQQMDDLRGIARRMHENLPGHPYIELLLAKLERKKGNLEAASKRLITVTQHELDADSSPKIYDELGRILDAMGHYPEAMKAFARAQHDYAAPIINSSKINKQSFYDTISRNINWFVPENVKDWGKKPFNDDVAAPVFIVGFPRSGTTLIEQILAAHSKVIVSDERPILVTLLNQIPEILDTHAPYPEVLNQLDDKHLSSLRKQYWQLCKESLGFQDSNKIFIDKLPLNSIHLGFINRIFPDAKIVIALRDPRDVCLSCYLQIFQLNPAMIQFTELETTAKAYSAVMNLLTHYRKVLKLDVIEYRYEDIVENTEATARKILSFLKLEWEQEILSFYQFKRKRTITTPSHEAVTNPVYTKAVGRWKNYKDEMNSILPTIEPFVKKFNYKE